MDAGDDYRFEERAAIFAIGDIFAVGKYCVCFRRYVHANQNVVDALKMMSSFYHFPVVLRKQRLHSEDSGVREV